MTEEDWKGSYWQRLRRADVVAHTCNPDILALRRLRQITVKVKPAWDG